MYLSEVTSDRVQLNVVCDERKGGCTQLYGLLSTALRNSHNLMPGTMKIGETAPRILLTRQKSIFTVREKRVDLRIPFIFCDCIDSQKQLYLVDEA